MTVIKNNSELEKALTGLLEKYHVNPPWSFKLYNDGNDDTKRMLPGYYFPDPVLKKNQIPLLTWRVRRKFVELKKIIDESVIENAGLFRFCCLGSKDQWSLSALLYRELDLIEFLGNGIVISVQAVISDNQAGNVIVRLDNNSLCSIEIGIQMPPGSSLIERHEIIAQRGVASDLVVDSQVPQSSIYSYTRNGENRYTDVDMELFGFDNMQIDHIRSAFHAIQSPDLTEEWKRQHKHLVCLVQKVFESDNKHKRIFIK